jgi:hypothetical protein
VVSPILPCFIALVSSRGVECCCVSMARREQLASSVDSPPSYHHRYILHFRRHLGSTPLPGDPTSLMWTRLPCERSEQWQKSTCPKKP